MGREWIADRDFSILLSCGCVFEATFGSCWQGEGPRVGWAFWCQPCAERCPPSGRFGASEIIAIDDPVGGHHSGPKRKDWPKVNTIEQSVIDTDPTAAVSAWVTRMTMRHGPVVFDQITRTTATWHDALAEIRYPGKQWLVTPLFNSLDIDYANRWETVTWPSDGGWPHRYVPMSRVDNLRHCSLEDHEFVFTKDTGDTEFSLYCLNPCRREELAALWIPNDVFNWGRDEEPEGGSYHWNPCVEYPELWLEDADFRAAFSVEIPLKLEVVTERWTDHYTGDHESTLYADPIFEKDSEVCTGCGRAMKRPRVALSRRGSYNVCPRCGPVKPSRTTTPTNSCRNAHRQSHVVL